MSDDQEDAESGLPAQEVLNQYQEQIEEQLGSARADDFKNYIKQLTPEAQERLADRLENEADEIAAKHGVRLEKAENFTLKNSPDIDGPGKLAIRIGRGVQRCAKIIDKFVPLPVVDDVSAAVIYAAGGMIEAAGHAKNGHKEFAQDMVAAKLTGAAVTAIPFAEYTDFVGLSARKFAENQVMESQANMREKRQSKQAEQLAGENQGVTTDTPENNVPASEKPKTVGAQDSSQLSPEILAKVNAAGVTTAFANMNAQSVDGTTDVTSQSTPAAKQPVAQEKTASPQQENAHQQARGTMPQGIILNYQANEGIDPSQMSREDSIALVRQAMKGNVLSAESRQNDGYNGGSAGTKDKSRENAMAM